MQPKTTPTGAPDPSVASAAGSPVVNHEAVASDIAEQLTPLSEVEQARYDAHLQELRSYGLARLEGRMQRGLDPAGMLAIGETRTLVERICQSVGADMVQVDAFTKALHVGDVWRYGSYLQDAVDQTARMWLLLALACEEQNGVDLTPRTYLADVDRVLAQLRAAAADPTAVDTAVRDMHERAEHEFVRHGEIGVSDSDAFLSMSMSGLAGGVCREGDLSFVGAHELDYTMLSTLGLNETRREDRGREVTFFQRDGKDVVKVLYPGLAIVFGDEALALQLAATAKRAPEGEG